MLNRKPKMQPEKKHRVSLWVWYGFVLFASIFLSIGGFFYGAKHSPTSDGGRGGAIAVAIAFIALFIRSNFAEESYALTAEVLPPILRHMHETLNKFKGKVSPDISEPPSVQELQNRVNGIITMIAANAKEQTKQNVCIAIASAIGTLSWGFGDLAAQSISNHHLIERFHIPMF